MAQGEEGLAQPPAWGLGPPAAFLSFVCSLSKHLVSQNHGVEQNRPNLYTLVERKDSRQNTS